jgi:purine-cytosine permease-like protein
MRSALIPLVVLLVLVTVTYYRFRNRFFDVAQASDSRRSNSFWVAVGLIFSAIMVWLYLAVHAYFLSHSY